MIKSVTIAAALATATTAGVAQAASHAADDAAKGADADMMEGALTEAQIDELRTAWGEGIVAIGAVHTNGGDAREAASEHIEEFYAYEEGAVLFKPTLAAQDQFRGTFEEALSYFVGAEAAGDDGIAEDGGFAIAPYTDVRWENEGTIISGDTAMAMGNYYFTQTDGSEVKVEYTFGIERMEDGDAKIVLHHSSLPFSAS